MSRWWALACRFGTVRIRLPRRVHHHGGGPQKIVIYQRLRDAMPRPLRRYVQHFEARIEDAVEAFAARVNPRARVLDAGAGEGNYKHHFDGRIRYCGLDLAVGDAAWNYSRLDVVGDLMHLPFRDATFDACLNVVTLEHVPEPGRVVQELARTLAPGGRLLLIAPHEWEGAPGAARLFPLHALRAPIFAGASRADPDRDRAGGRIFPAALAADVQLIAIFRSGLRLSRPSS